MRILGVDPGSRAAGWAVLEFEGSPRLAAAGVLRPPTDGPFATRLLALRDGLLAVVDRERPEVTVVERVFSGVNPQSLISLGEARGALLVALAERGLPVFEITPAEIKKTVTGTGLAEKEQVRKMVGALLALPAQGRRLPLDAADAAAAALSHGYLSGAHRGTAAGPAPRGPGSGIRRRPSG